MQDKLSFTSTTEDKNNNENNNHGKRSVELNSDELMKVADKISQSMIEKHTVVKPNNENELNEMIHHRDVDNCIDNLDFASWDADGWHYTGANFKRDHLSKEEEERQRFERVALYVLMMDCINFCFWPVDDGHSGGTETCNSGEEVIINLLEYEHLAIALKKLAEADDILDVESKSDATHGSIQIKSSKTMVQAENSYSLSPQNLVNLDAKTFSNMIQLPQKLSDDVSKGVFFIPNIAERTRLIVELGQSLLTFYNGSATQLIAKANQSADTLVYLILQSLPGFRDATVHNGRFVAFYKRAQILVADLWAALGKVENLNAGDIEVNSSTINYCYFQDMDKITTFADYRVPQLLRHMDVLIYSPDLAYRVDNMIEILPFSNDEVYIRAATVVAVDKLVNTVKAKLRQWYSNSNEKDFDLNIIDNVNAVKMDWYLWNIGEKLDRNDTIGNHHRVRTIFY